MKAVFVIQVPDQVRAHRQRVTEVLRKEFPTAMQVVEPPVTTCWPSSTSHRRTGGRSGGTTRLSASTRRASAAPTSGALPGRRLDRAADWRSAIGAAGGMAAEVVASYPRPPWPRSRSQTNRWSSPMVMQQTSRPQPSTEPDKRFPQSTPNSTIAGLHIHRSGFIVNKRR